jgi:hypothetical protein
LDPIMLEDGVGRSEKESDLPMTKWTVMIVDAEEHVDEEVVHPGESDNFHCFVLFVLNDVLPRPPTPTCSTRFTSKARSTALHPLPLSRFISPLLLGPYILSPVSLICLALRSVDIPYRSRLP